MNKNRLIDMYAAHGWPIVRNFVSLSKRCSRCIVSERYTPLKNGLCGACLGLSGACAADAASPDETLKSLEADFEKMIHAHTGRGRYDAVLMLSGGKDSAYILHRLKKEFPAFKVLCVIVDNGFMSPHAVNGARHVADKLHADLMIVNSHVDEFAAVIRRAFLSLDGRGAYGVVDFADGELIFEVGRRIATELGIPLMIGGLSWVQVQMIVGIDSFALRRPGEPAQIFPLAVWRVNEQEIRAQVRALGLLPPGTDSPVQSNSDLILAMSVIDVLNLGYCSFEPEFAQMVRQGKTERKTWLHVFELLEYGVRRGFFKKDLERTLGRLDIKLSEVVKT